MAGTRRSRSTDAPNAKKPKTGELNPEEPWSGEIIEEGDFMPSVTLENQDYEEINLAKDHKRGFYILFAYPKASSPGCTEQTRAFSGWYKDFQEMGVDVYGISADPPKKQKTFKNKTRVKFDLLSDPNYELLGPLGAKKSPKGVIRSHWLVYNNQIITADYKVTPTESVNELFEFVIEYTTLERMEGSDYSFRGLSDEEYDKEDYEEDYEEGYEEDDKEDDKENGKENGKENDKENVKRT